MRRILRPLLLLLLPLPFLGAPLAQEQGEERASARRAWPHEASDLPLDPRLAFGALDNGLRYVWAANENPRGRLYLRLVVEVGSLHEQDEERGMAHFVEHMAFNGTRRFPAGRLIEWFQSQGMAFGADTNASTGFERTVYRLDLARSDRESLREGLAVLRDFADGILFEPEEVQAEKGVIDGEERERDSAAFRAQKELLAHLYDGLLHEQRLPIGTREARAAFDDGKLLDFYERWYRPERMTLVLVGDLGELDPTPLVTEAFRDLAPALPEPPAEPELGRASLARLSFAIVNEELSAARVTYAALRPWEPPPLDVERLLADLPLQAAFRMLGRRFDELRRDPRTPFLAAGAGLERGERGAPIGPALQVESAPERWREAFAAAENELRRALLHGFSTAELEEVRRSTLRALEVAIENEPTRHSLALAGELLAAAEGLNVPARASDRRALLAPALEALEPEACRAALVQAWEQGRTGLWITTPRGLGEQPAKQLAAALEAAREVEVLGRAQVEDEPFAYASSALEEGASGVLSREHLEELDAHLVHFTNGVRLLVKRTDYSRGQIDLRARLGEGKLALAPEEGALCFVAERAFDLAGLEAHSPDELRRLLAGRVVGWSSRVEADALVFAGRTSAADLLLELELLSARLAHPGWREDGIVLLRRGLPLYFQELATRLEGPLLQELLPKLLGGDLRLVPLPPLAVLEQVTMDELREWLAPQLAEAPLEVAVVGDLEVEDALAAAERTLGRLPPRRAPLVLEDARKLGLGAHGLRLERTVQTQVPRALVLVVQPCGDGIDPARARDLAFLAEVLADRLRRELRERLGLAYSPGAEARLSEVFEGLGWIEISTSAEPARVEAVAEAALGVLRALAQDGLEGTELERLREPWIARLGEARRTNGYWAAGLLDALDDPARRAELADPERFLRAMEPEALSALAREAFDVERASLAIVRPAAVEAAAPREREER